MKPRRSAARVRVAAGVAAWSVAALLCCGAFGGTSAMADDTATNSSPVTVSGAGPFASLKVTVSQTTDLIDQVVKVSWTGGVPTQTNFAADYLQIMQCWGDGTAGPTRESCEFGNSADNRGGAQVATRQLDAGSVFADPAETQVETPENPYNDVPFVSASWMDDPANPGHQIHPTIEGDHQDLGQFFDAQSTNERALNLTDSDGTGQTFFETMTAQEAPGLGCGSSTTDADGQPWSPSCYLVVVPRGETEVNGNPSSDNGPGLVSSPLSATNWANRIVVPLSFTPIALACPIGSPEQRTAGQEVAEEAVHRWQAALCKQSGTVYSYAETSDDAARRQLLTSSPGLQFVTTPVAASTAGASGIVYAPVDVSGAVIAFNIDYSAYGADALRPLAGQRVPSINLTPRLVAKLITQSYQLGAPLGDPPLTAIANPHNVLGLTYDPDFFAVNPGLTGLNNGGGDALTSFTPSDVTQQLWAWINADPDARAFLDGTPDPWGMTVNPAYKGITDTAVPNSLPKQDTYCSPQHVDNTGSQPPDLCTLDYRPYAADMHDAARAASRGDTLSRAQWDSSPPLPHYKKVPLQISGQNTVIAFTDAATAARYSLPVANLENASGQFVGPTASALAAGVADMKATDVAGVVAPDPETTDPAAYPLTTITYAATTPGALSASARSGFAAFLDYATTTGQQVGADIGQLPDGYAPLSSALTAQTAAVSAGLRTYVAPQPTVASPVTPSPTIPATPTPTPSKKPAPKPSKHSPAPATKSVSPSTSPAPVTTLPPIVGFPIGRPPDATVTRLPVAPASVSSAASQPSQPTPPPIVAPLSTSPASAAPGTPAAAVTQSLTPIAEIRPTPSVPIGGDRYVVVLVLLVGGLCALSGPALLRLGRRPR